MSERKPLNKDNQKSIQVEEVDEEDPRMHSVNSIFESVIQTKYVKKKFLIVPSLCAGVCLGSNNFLLGNISYLGVQAASEFSLGALILTTIYRISTAIFFKYKCGSYFPIEHSNFFTLDGNGERKIKRANVLAILIRPFINVSFQISIIMAFKYATLAQLNSGVITAMFSTYCIFTSILTWVVFGEKLQLKFVLGISLLICGVAAISLSSFHGTEGSSVQKEVYYALGFGLLAPLLISISITVARYFTQYHQYSCLDFTMDTFTVIGLLEIPVFVYFDFIKPFTLADILNGLGASVFQVVGTILMIYASTFGLAGPASAMVQSQCIIQTILVVIFKNTIPSNLQIAGMGCAIAGAMVMSIDLSACFGKKEDEKDQIDRESMLDENGFIRGMTQNFDSVKSPINVGENTKEQDKINEGKLQSKYFKETIYMHKNGDTSRPTIMETLTNVRERYDTFYVPC